jgi:hypothetical protein
MKTKGFVVLLCSTATWRGDAAPSAPAESRMMIFGHGAKFASIFLLIRGLTKIRTYG